VDTSDNFFGRIRRPGVCDDAHRVAGGESGQRHLFDRAALPKPSGEARIMHHPSAADIDAMMTVPTARTSHVVAEAWLRLESQRQPRGGSCIVGHHRDVVVGCGSVGCRSSRDHAEEHSGDQHGNDGGKGSNGSHGYLLQLESCRWDASCAPCNACVFPFGGTMFQVKCAH